MSFDAQPSHDTGTDLQEEKKEERVGGKGEGQGEGDGEEEKKRSSTQGTPVRDQVGLH